MMASKISPLGGFIFKYHIELLEIQQYILYYYIIIILSNGENISQTFRFYCRR